MSAAAAFLITVSATQLNVVRDALVLASSIGIGSFAEVQKWWGDDGGHGTMLRGNLEGITKKMIGLHPKTIAAAPRPAQVAWDLAAAIRLAQAANRLKKAPEYHSLPLHTEEPCARVDQFSGANTLGSLSDLEAIPVSPSGIPSLRLHTARSKEHPMSKSLVKKPAKKVAKKAVAAKKAK